MTEKEIKHRIQEIADKIAIKYRPEKIILFGSFAWGNPNKDSDVDLLIIKRTNKNKFERGMDLRSKLDAELPMDILIYTPEEIIRSVMKYKNLFIEDILRNGKVIYSKPGSTFNTVLPKRRLNILH